MSFSASSETNIIHLEASTRASTSARYLALQASARSDVSLLLPTNTISSMERGCELLISIFSIVIYFQYVL